ncbi:hypothetical protein AB0F11_15655 [Streptomyces sp. NPDC032472]|uniref:hypothetical protein n=1 Tax=Streptomyces sp. NPDC032472 TaxID=3155018 RepID=UPI00340C1D55
MARISVEGAEVVVRLSLREWLGARRRELRVPVAALRGVGLESSWWRVLRGAPGRGAWRPGRCVGIRRVDGGRGRDFVAVKAGGPVLWIDLDRDAAFGRLALSVPDPEGAERALRALLPAEPEEGPGPTSAPAASARPLLQHEGGTADDHGREPGVPSRTGTGAQPPAADERVRRANTGAADTEGDVP